jgi:Prp8 binding protein
LAKKFGVLKPKQPRTLYTTLCFSPLVNSPHLFAGCTDGTISTFNAATGQSVRRHRPSSTRVVNSVDCVRGTGRELLLTAGDDGVARIWTPELKEALEEIELGYPLTAAKWSLDGQQIFLGGIDNDVHCYDLRKKDVVYSLRGAGGCAVSPSC